MYLTVKTTHCYSTSPARSGGWWSVEWESILHYKCLMPQVQAAA